MGGIPSAAISIEAAMDEGAAITSGAMAGVTTAAASLTTTSGMAGVIGGSLAGEAATSTAIVNRVVVGGMVGNVAEGAIVVALTAVTTRAESTHAFSGDDPPSGPSSMPMGSIMGTAGSPS
jgi:hypothetical protein